ncbi:tripartite tricarboxylate transporter TctB family protein [Granulosicoccus sp. 3-233]|uniref:tripartite tricarboxylate transporter TctB family protein n=1 Tax=Granulosicoccus sp. 3-233 TaxID=3417969 RepID=UPI003D32BAD3
MQSMKKAAFPILLLIFSTGYLVTARGLGPSIVDGRLSPSFFPSILGTLAVLLSLILVGRAAREANNDEESDSPAGIARYRVLLITAATAFFILVFQQIGYVFSATAYVLSIILIFSDRTRLPSKFLMALATSLGAYLLFTQAFNVRLPGLWS